jgi:phosphoribosylformylglycinamidine cyclo-ligase
MQRYCFINDPEGMVGYDKKDKLSYRDAGVDIDAASSAKRKIGELVKSTFTEGVLTEIGGFGGLFEVPAGMKSPALVASADGVGTKLKIAFLSGVHNTVGQDLVNHCVNDILCTGARPLFFLDYLAVGKLDPGTVASIVEGLSIACKENACALIGGETAEMPDFYPAGEYDLAGTIVGILEKDRALTGESIEPGDQLIALPSSGLHTNGYSLVRKIVFEVLGLSVNDFVAALGCTIAEELLKVHRCYARLLREPIDNGLIKSLAHITGGGITDNLPRSLPSNCTAVINQGSWPVLPVFDFLRETGNIDTAEMYHVFNMGVGMIAVVAPGTVDTLNKHLHTLGERPYGIGQVIRGSGGVEYA